MAANGVIPTPEDFDRIARSVKRTEQDGRYGKRQIPTRKRYDPASGCTRQNAKVQFTVLGSPTGGSFDAVTWNVDGTSGTPTFDYDFTAAEVKTEMVSTFSNITTAELTATGGPFPDATIELEFTGDLANTNIALPNLDWSSLTGGSGVGVITSLSQLGVG